MLKFQYCYLNMIRCIIVYDFLDVGSRYLLQSARRKKTVNYLANYKNKYQTEYEIAFQKLKYIVNILYSYISYIHIAFKYWYCVIV